MKLKILTFIMILGIFLNLTLQDVFSIPFSQNQTQTFSPNEVVVIFKSNQSPEELEREIGRRNETKQTFLGSLKIMLENIKLSVSRQETPETQFKQIQNVDNKASVTKRTVINQDKSSGKTTYLLTLRENNDILKIVDMYKNLQQVEDAQPNYIRTIR